MFRLILGVVLGVAAGVLGTFVLEAVGHGLYPPPKGIDFADPDVMRNAMALITTPAKIAVLVAWGGGVFAGAMVADLVAERRALAGWIAAVVLFGAAAFTMTQIPHPMWMMAGAVVVDLAAAYAAARLFGRRA